MLTSTDETGLLIKQQLAGRLKSAIMDGRLRPGQRVVEVIWAREFEVAQSSVREAINLLIAEGFLVKDAGRSARVTRYTEQDIVHIYAARGAMEGLAAQLAAAAKADLSALEAALDRMEAAVAKEDLRGLVEADLAFHLALAEASGNPFLIDVLSRILRPLFAFVLLRVMEVHQGTISWLPDLPRHREIVYLIQESNPAIAAQFVQHCIGCFMLSAQSVWSPRSRTEKGRRPARQ